MKLTPESAETDFKYETGAAAYIKRGRRLVLVEIVSRNKHTLKVCGFTHVIKKYCVCTLDNERQNSEVFEQLIKPFSLKR